MNNDNNRRRSIWDMNPEDTNLYLILFIALMAIGASYALWFRFAYEQVPIAEQVIAAVRDVGVVGGSAAIISFAIIVIRRGIMALIDWPSKEKYRAEGRAEGIVEGIAQNQNEWLRWNNRRLEAERRGEKFDEPPPGV